MEAEYADNYKWTVHDSERNKRKMKIPPFESIEFTSQNEWNWMLLSKTPLKQVGFNSWYKKVRGYSGHNIHSKWIYIQ